MMKSLKTEQCFYQSANFRNTSFVKSIRKEFGLKGYALIIATLEEISRNGISVCYDQSFCDRIISDFPEVSQNLLDMVVRKMVKSEFLDREAFYKKKVLTPPERCIMDRIEDVWLTAHDETRPYLFVKNQSYDDN